MAFSDPAAAPTSGHAVEAQQTAAAQQERERISEDLIKNFEEDSKWLTDYYNSDEKEDGVVIAIKNKKITHTSDSIIDLLETLRKEEENMAFMLVAAIPPKEASFIL